MQLRGRVVLLSTRSPWCRRWVDGKVRGPGQSAAPNFSAVGGGVAGDGPRWEELHALASEPREQHVLLAEQVEDATNGLLSTLSKSGICTVASPGKAS